ncbi:hypothetical protein FQA39_LY15821 [Lamprigera yunnana]|nr:hypothetical protein FQA39_LY15821 [Lamprigera yunnana]
MSVDKFGRLPRTGVHTDKNRIEDLMLRVNQLESSVNDDINAIIGIIPTAIKSKIDVVFKAMFDANLHLTRFTSMEVAFRHILNRTAEIESTAAITAHIFSILVAKFSEGNLFKPEVIAYMRLLIDQILERTKNVEYEYKKDRARNEGRASGDGRTVTRLIAATMYNNMFNHITGLDADSSIGAQQQQYILSAIAVFLNERAALRPRFSGHIMEDPGEFLRNTHAVPKWQRLDTATAALTEDAAAWWKLNQYFAESYEDFGEMLNNYDSKDVWDQLSAHIGRRDRYNTETIAEFLEKKGRSCQEAETRRRDTSSAARGHVSSGSVALSPGFTTGTTNP